MKKHLIAAAVAAAVAVPAAAQVTGDSLPLTRNSQIFISRLQKPAFFRPDHWHLREVVDHAA